MYVLFLAERHLLCFSFIMKIFLTSDINILCWTVKWSEKRFYPYLVVAWANFNKYLILWCLVGFRIHVDSYEKKITLFKWLVSFHGASVERRAALRVNVSFSILFVVLIWWSQCLQSVFWIEIYTRNYSEM